MLIRSEPPGPDGNVFGQSSSLAARVRSGEVLIVGSTYSFEKGDANPLYYCDRQGRDGETVSSVNGWSRQIDTLCANEKLKPACRCGSHKHCQMPFKQRHGRSTIHEKKLSVAGRRITCGAAGGVRVLRKRIERQFRFGDIHARRGADLQ